MIEVFADNDPGVQAHRGHAAIDYGRRNRCRLRRLAAAAGVLRTDVPMHEEAAGSTSNCSLMSSPILNLALEGKSYRLKEAEERAAPKAKARSAAARKKR